MFELVKLMETETIVKTTYADPPKFNIRFWNDNTTPMDLVVYVLNSILSHPIDRATFLMMEVHTKGSAIVGTYSLEIASEKTSECLELIHGHGYIDFRASIERA